MQNQLAGHGNQNQTMRYERLLPLGVGGMATVHLALALGQSGFNRLVVLKSVREGLPESGQMRQMFVNEARLTARLNHPNIVQAFEIIEDHDAMVLVMEYLDGLSLTEAYRAARHELSLPMRLRIICEVLTGLHYAHDYTDYQGAALGIVHRDVTPTNVFVTFDGRVKLLDFGIAKMTSTEDRTRTGMIKGKLAYMPAEQLAGRVIDRRTDIYAVGCLLWEAIAGSRIWEGRSEVDVARSVLAGKIPALSSRVSVDTALDRIVTRATAPDPDARYGTAAEMRDELEHFMSALPVETPRDVGELLATVCAEARHDRQQQVARAIRQVEANLARERSENTAGAPVLSEPPANSDGNTERAGAPASQPSISAASGRTTLRAPSWSVGRTLVLTSFTVLVSAVAWSQWSQRTAPSRPAPPDLPPPNVSAQTVSPTLTIQAVPKTARVFVDGVRVLGSPATIQISSASDHVLRVELEGHQTSERRIRVDADTLLTVDLVPTPAVATSTAPKRDVPLGSPNDRGRAVRPIDRPASKPLEKERSAKGTCNPPYYFSGGIKTYKLECI